jgi:hypothetical protein
VRARLSTPVENRLRRSGREVSTSSHARVSDMTTCGPVKARSDGEPVAALAAARGQDRATGTGPHPEAEAVRLVATTVVRLERALAHGLLRCVRVMRSRVVPASHRAGRLEDATRSSACRLAPPTRGEHPGRSSGRAGVECTDSRPGGSAVDMRHRSTLGSTVQRYAVPRRPVKPVQPVVMTSRRNAQGPCGQRLDPQDVRLLACGRPEIPHGRRPIDSTPRRAPSRITETAR